MFDITTQKINKEKKGYYYVIKIYSIIYKNKKKLVPNQKSECRIIKKISYPLILHYEFHTAQFFCNFIPFLS